MAYINLCIILFSITAYSTLPKMMTKIPLDSIRFISQDGKVTLYQKSSGVLSKATNFNSEDILKLEPYTHFTANSIKGSPYIAIEADDSFNSNNDALKDYALYLLKRTQDQPKKIGTGKNLTLHLSGTFVSYFKSRSKKILIQPSSDSAPANEISIASKLNPYFVPENLMIDANTFLYTDINEENLAGLLYFNRSTQEISPLFKSAEKGTRIELCQQKNDLIIGEFTYPGTNLVSNIYKMKATGNLIKNKIVLLYSSEKSDLGHLVCTDEFIYFIKDIKSNGPLNNRVTELFSLNANSKIIKQVSDLKKVFQVFNMDGRVLIPVADEFYVVEGQSNEMNDQLKKSEAKK